MVTNDMEKNKERKGKVSARVQRLQILNKVTREPSVSLSANGNNTGINFIGLLQELGKWSRIKGQAEWLPQN